jgi:hypothetical protein
MGQMGQYIQSKRMAMAMDGLIRSEYPGDFLRTIEIATFARTVPPGEIISLMPKPVTIRDSVVRMRVDMADPEISESMVHPHFTNIQHGLSLARRHLANVDTPNKQVILFTDGLPTAHFENGPETGIRKGGNRRRELSSTCSTRPTRSPSGRRCARRWRAPARASRSTSSCSRAGARTRTTSRSPSGSPSRRRGACVFVGGEDLDRFVLWDYVNQRRKIIG